MQNITDNSKNVIRGICINLLLWTLGANGAELRPDPNNAALMYYQAVALWSDVRSSYVDPNPIREPNDASNAKTSTGSPEWVVEFPTEEDSDSSRRRLRRLTLELIETASRIRHCTWGPREWSQPALGALRHLPLLLADDARTLTEDREYRKALARCLTIRRFARHLGDEKFMMHVNSLGFDTLAFNRIRHVLGTMPPDAETLSWLQVQLAATPGASRSPAEALRAEFEVLVQAVRKNPKLLRGEIDYSHTKIAINSSEFDAWLSLTDEEMVSQATQKYRRFLDAVLLVIASNKPYEEKEKELATIHDRLQASLDPGLLRLDNRFVDLSGRLDLQFAHTARLNGLIAAIEVYLEVARTGRLPKVLPNGLPKDPFSNKDFAYEITNNGFALRCSGRDFQGRGRRMLEFKVRTN